YHVAAMVLAARHPVAQDYVVATGVSHSVRDFVAAAFAAAGVVDPEHFVGIDPALVRPTDAADLRGAAGRARRELGWAPTQGFAGVVAAMVAAGRAGRAGSAVVGQPHPVRAVPTLAQRLGALQQLGGGEPALPPGHRLGGADLGALARLDRAHEVGGVVEGV